MTLDMELLHRVITLSVLVWAFISFVREKIEPHITAFAAMAILLATGVINTQETLSVFSNSAPITIACMFVISAALERTGVIDLVGQYVIKGAEKNAVFSVLGMFALVIIMSAFMNNTPIVIILTPIMINLAKSLSHNPSKYLMPLSYIAVLGGLCTLLGTSTNIIVDGVARNLGQPAFGMFEITLAGLALTVVGCTYLALIGRHLIPNRMMLETEVLGETAAKRFLAEATIQKESELVGKTLNDLQDEKEADYDIVDLIRGNTAARSGLSGFFAKVKEAIEDAAAKPRSTMRDIPLQAGDRLVFKTSKEQLLEIKEKLNVNFDKSHDGDDMYMWESTVVEGMIGRNSRLVGRRVSDLQLRRYYSSYILAIHRKDQSLTGDFAHTELQFGDVVLFEGPQGELQRMFDHEEIISITQAKGRRLHKRKAPIVIAVLLAVVGLSAGDIMPIAGLAIIGATIVILTGCIKPEKAYESIEWSILLLIFGTVALSIAMEKTGMAKLLVSHISDYAKQLGPVGVLAIIFIITSVFTEIMSNAATVVLLTPVAIGIAESMGVNPRPFIVAVMFAASASFATPIGYQTNTYVYNIGNYKFSDFVKVGVPLNILMMITSVIVIPLIWKF